MLHSAFIQPKETMARYTVDISEQSHVGSIFLFGIILAVAFMACGKGKKSHEQRIIDETTVISK